MGVLNFVERDEQMSDKGAIATDWRGLASVTVYSTWGLSRRSGIVEDV
jgi:hypothetical protein